MRYKFSQLLLFLVLLIALIGCNENEESNTVIIRINAPSFSDSLVEVVSVNVLNYEEILLESMILDSMGNGTVQFSQTDPVFGSVKIGDNYFKIYLEAGFDLKATLVSKPETSFISYTGKGSENNNYLSGSNFILKEFQNKHPTWFLNDLTDVSIILDSLQRSLESFHTGYLDTVALNNTTQEMFKVRSALNLINLKQQHRLINSAAYKAENIPSSLKNTLKEIPFKEKYLDLAMAEYAQVLDLFLRLEIQEPVYKEIEVEELDSLKEKFPILTNKLIKGHDFPLGIKEFLIAKDISYWLASEGISWGLDTVYNEFKKVFNNSVYSDNLEMKYAEWMSIARGQPAPEITGLTIENDTLSLSQLKGKVVYIDVWATWCGPCIAEFPFYKNIQEEFEGNDEIEFLFVSVDSDHEKWIRFIKEETIPVGNQIHELLETDHPPIQESYKMWGVPRYILIDRQGMIFDAKAHRPSSGKVVNLIKKMINK
ncbi:MAG: TlpA disulfide reductase family protein [Flavobacteriales bacterium]|nr:TlpA disulfide reductase family protein [Flavobacteriales bacterium]